MPDLRLVDTRSRAFVGGTLANDVLHRLREDIVSCTLRPGERLRFETLREIYGASFSTLREALSRLSSENLVAAEGQRGFSVAPISRADLLDLTDARVIIERECIARSIRHGDKKWRSALLSAFHRLDRIEADEVGQLVDSGEWEALHSAFHEALVACSGSAILMEIRAGLFERARRYRRISTMVRRLPRKKSAEHRAMMEAALAGDIETAQNLIATHIRRTADNVLQAMFPPLEETAGT